MGRFHIGWNMIHCEIFTQVLTECTTLFDLVISSCKSNDNPSNGGIKHETRFLF